jgi:hypothetical protein
MHRTLVNAGTTAMFWGPESELAALVLEAERESNGPGSICEANAEGNLVVYLWLEWPHEACIAEKYWPGCVEEGKAFAASHGIPWRKA